MDYIYNLLAFSFRMAKRSKDSSMSPITFKISQGMLEIIEEIVKSGEYSNRAELIRDAIDELLYEEEMYLKAKSAD